MKTTRTKQASDAYTLCDDKAKAIAKADLDLCVRYMKHECPDGEYSIEGPLTNATFYRIGGVVYPSGGLINNERMPPRTRDECRQVFDGHNAK